VTICCIGVMGGNCPNKASIAVHSDTDAIDRGWLWTDDGWLCPDCKEDFKMIREAKS
jgi:hypothetical protein